VGQAGRGGEVVEGAGGAGRSGQETLTGVVLAAIAELWYPGRS
jgi:hypothetical protein